MHISVVSELYKVTPAKWLDHINALDQAKTVMVSLYAPLRQAILAELSEGGTGKQTLERYLSTRKSTALLKSVGKRSRTAFDRFLLDVRPEITALDENLLSVRDQSPSVYWESFELSGRFHFSYYDADKVLNYAYVNAADWAAPKKEAYLELLAIIAERRYSAKRQQVVLIDLMGKSALWRPNKTFKSTRRELARTLDLLDKLRKISKIAFEEEER